MFIFKIVFVLLNATTCFAAEHRFYTHVNLGFPITLPHPSYILSSQAEEKFVTDVTYLYQTSIRAPQSQEYYDEHRTLCYKIMNDKNAIPSTYIGRVGQWVIDLCLPLPTTTHPYGETSVFHEFLRVYNEKVASFYWHHIFTPTSFQEMDFQDKLLYTDILIRYYSTHNIFMYADVFFAQLQCFLEEKDFACFFKFSSELMDKIKETIEKASVNPLSPPPIFINIFIKRAEITKLVVDEYIKMDIPTREKYKKEFGEFTKKYLGCLSFNAGENLEQYEEINIFYSDQMRMFYLSHEIELLMAFHHILGKEVNREDEDYNKKHALTCQKIFKMGSTISVMSLLKYKKIFIDHQLPLPQFYGNLPEDFKMEYKDKVITGYEKLLKNTPFDVTEMIEQKPVYFDVLESFYRDTLKDHATEIEIRLQRAKFLRIEKRYKEAYDYDKDTISLAQSYKLPNADDIKGRGLVGMANSFKMMPTATQPKAEYKRYLISYVQFISPNHILSKKRTKFGMAGILWNEESQKFSLDEYF